MTTLAKHLALAMLLVMSCAATAQRAPSATDAQIVDEATLVATGAHVTLYRHGGIRVDAAFLNLAEDAYRRIETLTGRKLDTVTLGEKVRLYVSDAIFVSHVWRGYDHPRDPRGAVFLSSRAYLAALRGNDATYIHELAHLFTWRYSSHTLREGLADYVALLIRPGASVGPNTSGYQASGAASQEIMDHLGTTRRAPPWLSSSLEQRQAYYYASYRLVKYLVEKKDIETFMKLYDSANPEAELHKVYGETREALVRAAMMD